MTRRAGLVWERWCLAGDIVGLVFGSRRDASAPMQCVRSSISNSVPVSGIGLLSPTLSSKGREGNPAAVRVASLSSSGGQGRGDEANIRNQRWLPRFLSLGTCYLD